MPKTVLLDEWHLTFRFPASLPDVDVRAIRRVLNSTAFTAAVRRGVLAEMNKWPVLKLVRMTVGR